MGIDSFRDLGLKEKEQLFPHSHFAGQRIAVDGNNVSWIQMNIAMSKQVHKTQLRTQKVDLNAMEKIWIMGVLNFLEMYFLSHSILPLFVFDGEPRPEKIKELQKRSKNKKNPRKELDDLEWQIESYANPEDIPSKLLTRYKQLLSNNPNPTEANQQNLELILTQLGIPVLHAQHDAEELCCMLVREGHASAVYSTDTDCLVFGTSQWLKGVDRKGFVGVTKKEALEYKNYSFSTFVEVCVAAGCDFFKIKGVSMKTAIRLVEQYGSILNFPEKYEFDTEEYQATRRIFSMKPCSDLCENLQLEPQPNRISTNETRDILALFGIPIQRGSKFFQALNDYMTKQRSNGEAEDVWDELF